MANVLLVTTGEAHICNRCKKGITVGSKAVKSVSPGSAKSCGDAPRIISTVYYHASCWHPARPSE